MFHASASHSGRKYTFEDIPKDCFQVQVDLLPFLNLFNFLFFYIVVASLFILRVRQP